MYIALKKLKGDLGTYGPGDSLPETKDWKPHVLRANVSMEYVGGTEPDDYERLHLPVPKVLPETPQSKTKVKSETKQKKTNNKTASRTTVDPLSCGVCGKTFKSGRALTCHKTRVGH